MLPRVGRFCFDQRRWVALGWLLLVLCGALAGGALVQRLQPAQGSDGWESVRAYDRIVAGAAYGPRVSAVVDKVSVDDPLLTAALDAARADLLELAGVGRVVDGVQTPAGQLVATDRQAVLVSVDLVRNLSNARQDSLTVQIEKRLHAIATEVPGATVTVGGNTVLRREVREQTARDTSLGELVALPLTLLAMIVIFGGFVAAGVPFLGAIASIFGGLVCLLGFTTFLEIDPSVLSVTTVMGLGLTIDYSLLMVSRFREELMSGLDARSAIVRTVETAGRTILFSALTVATSLGGLFVFPNRMFRAIGAAGVGVVVVALLAGLTLTPALLALFRHRISARAAAPTTDGFFARTARMTRRHALPVTIAITGLLLLGGAPFLHANFQNSNATLLPRSFESRDFADLVAARFPGAAAAPVTIVAQSSPAAVIAWVKTFGPGDGVASVGEAEQLSNGVTTISLHPMPSEEDRVARDLVEHLRAHRPPFAILVTGEAAVLTDFMDEIVSRAPWALALVALATFILLFAMTGSLLVPLKALVMNTLSLSASFGALVLIFQDGHGSGLLGFESTGGLETWVPVLVFAFAFGLSMDYEVFLLARIKELYDSGMSNDEAVEVGLQRSGRIITSAALVMIIVFCGFILGKMVSIKELGTAMAIAVAVDATLVRCLLVPATMTLLGDLNWWAPAPLRRLHDRFGLREGPSATRRLDRVVHERARITAVGHTPPVPTEKQSRTDAPE